MKRFVVIMTLLVLVISLFANDLQQPNKVAQETENFKTRVVETSHRNAPAVNFAVDPVEIAASYYDYMPGGYNTTPLRAQGEFSQPSNFNAGGQYFTYMYKETAGSERRVYYSYIDNNGAISTASPVSSTNIREGFPGIAIDPVTGNPFVSWHANTDGDSFYECPMTYDGFNIVGAPGLWNAPFNAIDNPMEEAGVFADLGDYIWPVVNIGPSPDPAKRRVHIYANFAPTTGTAEYNCIYGYSDVYFDTDAYGMVFDEWTFQTFPEWDEWQTNEVTRAIKEIAVSPTDGKVIFVGHGGNDMFAMYSDNYGETFEYRSFDYKIPVDNPLNEDGTPYFTNEDETPAEEVFFQPNSDGSHFNAIFTDDSRYVVFMSAMGLNHGEGEVNNTYLPATFYPKMFIYDTQLNEYNFVDLQVTGVDANDDQPMIPWDLDEDGVVDEYYDDEAGTVYFADLWPTYFFVGEYQDGSFHESLFKTTAHENWVVTVFQDGRNLRQAYWETEGYEDWAETPEIAITVSSDYGMTWSDVSYMNALTSDENYHAGLQGMTPTYVYAGDTITPVDETHGTLPIVFYDDNSYGSYEGSNNAGQPNGGTLMYAVIDIDFMAPLDPGSNNDGSTVPELVSSIKNYPNPFNPTTTISYELKTASNVSVEVFNSKGQKINTLVDGFKSEGPQSVTWTGNDSNGKAVSSGIYFYKLSTETSSTTKKMVLMK